jgi:hypothetical protein
VRSRRNSARLDTDEHDQVNGRRKRLYYTNSVVLSPGSVLVYFLTTRLLEREKKTQGQMGEAK